MFQRLSYDLLQQLLDHEYVTADQLAASFKVSAKTIRIRMKELNDTLKHHGAAIESKSRYGYRLSVEDPGLFLEWKESESFAESAIPGTQEERIYYLCAYLLSHDGYVKLDDLSEFLYVSKATLSTCLKQAETRLNQYGIHLERRPNYGIKSRGSEFNIRRCLRDLFLKCLKFEKEANGRTTAELKKLAGITRGILHHYKLHLSEIALENFLDDIYVAIRRMRQGHYIEFMELKVRGVGEHEWNFARDLAGRLEEACGVTYQEGELFYIALHLAGKKIVGAGEQDDGNFVIQEEIDRLVIDMLEVIRRESNLDFRNNFELRMNMNQHMVPLDIRLRYDIPLENPLLSHIREKYTMAYAIALQAVVVLKRWYQKEIPEDEIGYFALIFALALEQDNRPVEKSDILIVCSSGKGSSRLLKYKYEQEFKEYLGSIYICDLYELDTFDFNRVDYIFTTVPITRPVPRPIQEIGLFLEQSETETIRRFLARGKTGFLKEYYKPENFIGHLAGDSREEILEKICDYAEEKDHLPTGLFQSVMRRENLMATDFGNRVAIPHPAAVMTEETYVYTAILDHPVFWNRQEVSLVILTVIGRKEDRNLQKFYRTTTNMISDKEAVDALLVSPEYDTLIEQLKNHSIQ